MSDRTLTTRELLIALSRDQRQMAALLESAMSDMKRAGERFEHIAIQLQIHDSKIANQSTEHARLVAALEQTTQVVSALTRSADAALRLANAVQLQSEQTHQALFGDDGIINRLEKVEREASIGSEALRLAKKVSEQLKTYRIQIGTVISVITVLVSIYELVFK